MNREPTALKKIEKRLARLQWEQRYKPKPIVYIWQAEDYSRPLTREKYPESTQPPPHVGKKQLLRKERHANAQAGQ